MSDYLEFSHTNRKLTDIKGGKILICVIEPFSSQILYRHYFISPEPRIAGTIRFISRRRSSDIKKLSVIESQLLAGKRREISWTLQSLWYLLHDFFLYLDISKEKQQKELFYLNSLLLRKVRFAEGKLMQNLSLSLQLIKYQFPSEYSHSLLWHTLREDTDFHSCKRQLSMMVP